MLSLVSTARALSSISERRIGSTMVLGLADGSEKATVLDYPLPETKTKGEPVSGDYDYAVM